MKSKNNICPFCRSTKVVKNGRKKSGAQNFLCKSCRRQFLSDYLYTGADPFVKRAVLKHLLHQNGVRDTALLPGVSTGTVLRTLLKAAGQLKNFCTCHRYRHYHKVEIDEQGSYMGRLGERRKSFGCFTLYAELLGAVWGKRTRKTLRTLLDQPKDLQIDFFSTDMWTPFTKVFTPFEHLRHKRFTKRIEGTNTWFRARISRLRRRTTTVSKKT